MLSDFFLLFSDASQSLTDDEKKITKNGGECLIRSDSQDKKRGEAKENGTKCKKTDSQAKKKKEKKEAEDRKQCS